MMLSIFRSVKALSIAVLVIFNGSLTGDTVLRLGGSDLLPQKWQDHLIAAATKNQITLKLSLAGTIAAENGLRDGQLDLAIVARPEGFEISPEWRRIPFAFQVVILVVHRSNPVNSLNYDDLRSIFRSGGRADQWGAFTGESGWTIRKINPGLLRTRSGLSHEIFSHYVMQGQAMRATLTTAETTQTLLSTITDDVGSIVVLPTVPLTGVSRTMPIARGADAQAFSPTPDNVMFGDYPLRLPFYIIWDAANQNPARNQIIKEMLSDLSAQILGEHALMPLPESERLSYRLEFE